MLSTHAALSFIIASPFFSGLFATLLFGKRKKYSYPGLLFHSIHDKSILLGQSTISENKFRDFITLCKSKKKQGISLCETNQNTSPDDSFLLTFDDGFESVYTFAYPIMQDAGFKATVFCVSEFTNKTATWDVYRGLKHLSKSQLSEMARSGFEIGSHTCSHANLPYLSIKDQIIEMSDSKKALEDCIGAEVLSLSFPHGGWNPGIWQRAQEIGYKKATLYRGHTLAYKYPELYPVYGVYNYDSVTSIYSRIYGTSPISVSLAIANLMPHFAKGTPVWKFRKNYNVYRK
jgi:peptidoglycan/xylan/chitin deacetylase (PgdA/CDA1 family)